MISRWKQRAHDCCSFRTWVHQPNKKKRRGQSIDTCYHERCVDHFFIHNPSHWQFFFYWLFLENYCFLQKGGLFIFFMVGGGEKGESRLWWSRNVLQLLLASGAQSVWHKSGSSTRSVRLRRTKRASNYNKGARGKREKATTNVPWPTGILGNLPENATYQPHGTHRRLELASNTCNRLFTSSRSFLLTSSIYLPSACFYLSTLSWCLSFQMRIIQFEERNFRRIRWRRTTLNYMKISWNKILLTLTQLETLLFYIHCSITLSFLELKEFSQLRDNSDPSAPDTREFIDKDIYNIHFCVSMWFWECSNIF